MKQFALLCMLATATALLLLLCGASSGTANAADANGCTGVPNQHPILNATNGVGKLVRSVQNGSLYIVEG
jgi:hypothetical protein